MKRVDRANYCRDHSTAYEDAPQLIGFGQTISAPHVHALALKLLEPNLFDGDSPRSVLDVGSGSGYLAACFAECLEGAGNGGRVVGIDNSRGLVEWSLTNVHRDGKGASLKDAAEVTCQPTSPIERSSDASDPEQKSPVEIVLALGDGYKGYPLSAPYDAIHVGAAMEEVPEALLQQLKPGGSFVGPVGPRFHQEFLHIKKNLDGSLTSREVTSVRYVPLTKGFPKN
eukprot:CAMPEP_0172654556 /NCGR_PEP_ID=MMETSP1068-20121228/244396_1 /TAXON_ID=35684 /ORGANISM="Pseudopedinella elastica, Strain CCMP716" /LENGTH=226 /DNA_ID=CAMNT_0013469009 /DNA_START=441 /DNA_END=1121 /DNA_ORIENTATION=-